MATLTIQQVYDDLYTQLQYGSTAVLSNRNLPSETLWQLVADTLSSDPSKPLTQLTLFPPSQGGSVTLGPVSGNSLNVTGKINVLNLAITTAVTVTVTNGIPDISFTLTLPSGWTLGTCFQQFRTSVLDQWCGQLSAPELMWASNGKTKADALVLNADFYYQGIYSIINILYSGQVKQRVSAPIGYGVNGPAMDARTAIVYSGDGLLTVGPVTINTPYFYARVTYEESIYQEGLMLPKTAVAIGWNLKSQNASVSNFEISAIFLGDTDPFYLTGGYPDKDDVLALNDIVEAFFGSAIPAPMLPGPLGFLANDVGLENFSLSMTVENLPSLIDATIYIGTDPESNGWVIIGPSSDPLLALKEIHFRYSTANIDENDSINSVALGGTIKISKLLFLAEATYTWATNNQDYSIDANGLLQTEDGLPLRFTDLIRGLGAPRVADIFADFFELSFTEIGAEISYSSTNGVTACSWSAHAVADMELRFFGQEFLGLHNTTVQVSGSQSGADSTSYAISAAGDIYVLGITIPASLVLSEDTKTFTIGPLNFTLGGIITWMIHIIHPSWNYELPTPWNILNSIGFENMTIEFDMGNQTVSLDTGLKADFGFISLDSVRLTYHKRTAGSNQQGVIFAMKGKFLGMDIEVTTNDPDLKEGEMGWDLVNGKPIEVPGAGDELFELEYLGVGQHVAFRDTRQLRTIGDVITALEANFRPSTDLTNPLVKMTGLVFDENSGWLVGTKFTLIDTVTLSAIFNDPDLYGLRIELAGPKAQSLSGLQFEIMYKRITDTIGQYHINLRLPDAMRQLEFGEVSITIPEFVLDVYTNGNFKLDVGFPYNLNFSRSFSLEVFPFVGFGGFYFGYLEGATSDRVPVVSNGSFKPVLEFGLGLSIGVGKTIEKGILRAGATLTVEGILEGVLAWFNPDDKNLDSSMFYLLQGTVGIVGRVYGEIDFKVIKASVDFSAGASVTLTIESYHPVFIQLNVYVSASIKIKILFITIKCSFSIELTLEFTIGHASTPPWHVVEIGEPGSRTRRSLSAARHQVAHHPFTALRIAKAARRNLAMKAEPISLSGVILTGQINTGTAQATINLQFRPFFTQGNQGSLANNDSVPPAEKARSVAQLFTADVSGNGTDAEFAKLADLLFQREVEARLAQKTAQQDRVSLYDLEVIHIQLMQGLQDPDFSYTSLTEFFTTNNIVFSIDASEQTSAVSGTFFPIIPALTMKDWLTPKDGNRQNFISIDFINDPRFMVDQTYEEMVDTYFRLFKVNSESFLEKESAVPKRRKGTGGGTTESMAQYLFRDYFLMVTRSMVDSAVTYLESYPYTNTATTPVSLEAVAAEMSAVGDFNDENPTPLTIATANQSATNILDATQVSNTEIAGVYYQANSGETLTDIAVTRFKVGVAALVNCMNTNLGVANAAGPNMININVQVILGDITYTTTDDTMNLMLVASLFAVSEEAIENDPGNAGLDFSQPFPVGTEVKVPGAKYYTQENDTIAGMAARFQTTADTIANLNADMNMLIKPLSVWAVPPFKHEGSATDSFQSIAQNYVLSLEQLLNAGYAAAPIIKAGAALTIPYRPDIPKTDLYTVMGGTGMTDPIAQSVSRFMMYGLRLPQISPLTFDNMQPVFDNTGQQFDVPTEVLGASGADYTYELELTCNPAQQWVAFKDAGGTSAVYTYTADDRAELQVFNGNYDPESVTVLPMPLMTYVPNRYALRHVIHWQSSTGLAPVTGESTGGNGEPNIWLFPDNLLNRLAGPAADHTGATLGLEPTTTLKFNLAVGRQEKPNQPPQYTPVDHFAYGTMVEIGIQQVKAGIYSSEMVANAYLIAGADPGNRDLLFELWTYMADPGYTDTANMYLLYAADPASQANHGFISQNVVSVNTAVLKTNLSTTNTPVQGTQMLMTISTGNYAATIDNPKEFIKLLWECSSVNTGGFYLNYTEAGTGNGFPDNIFDKDGNGTLNLMVIFDFQRYSTGGAVAAQPPMLTLSNCAVLTDHLDLSNAELVVEGSTYTVEEGKSLNDVMKGMGFATMQYLVNVNQNVKVLLRVGLAIYSGSKTVVQPGDSLAMVAGRVGVTPVTIANEIAANTNALITGAILQYAEAQMKLFGTGPLGSVGMEVTRPNPDPGDSTYTGFSALEKLDLMFNLLGIDLVSNSFFASLPMTTPDGTAAGKASEWPPAGPVVPPVGSQTTKDNTWLYNKIVQYFPLATSTYNHMHDVPKFPPAKDNPYAGLGSDSDITFAFNFQDNFGNRTDTSTSLQNLTIPVGYKDYICAYSAWPGVASSFWVKKAATQPDANVFKFNLEIDSGYRVANYVSGNGQTYAQARKRLVTDQEKFFTIYYQLLQPDMQVAVATSLDTDTSTGLPAQYFVPKSSFVDIVNASLLFFNQLLALPQTTIKASAGDTIRTIDTTWLLVDEGAFLQANTTLAVGELFKLSATTPVNHLTIPVIVLSQAGQSLTNIASSASAAMGQTVTELQVAMGNELVPLASGTAVTVPSTFIPPTGGTPVGDASLQDLADTYNTTVTGLAAANASTMGILRSGTQISVQGIEYVITDSDTFSTLAEKVMFITVDTTVNTLQKVATVRGMSVGSLAFANETNTAIFIDNAAFTYPDSTGTLLTVNATSTDSLYTIAMKFVVEKGITAITVETLAEANKDKTGLLATNAKLSTGLLGITAADVAVSNAQLPQILVASARLTTTTYVIKQGDTLSSIVNDFKKVDISYTLDRFVTDNQLTGNLFPTGSSILAGTKNTEVDPTETITDLITNKGITYTLLGQFNDTVPLNNGYTGMFAIPDRTEPSGIDFSTVQPAKGKKLTDVASMFTGMSAGDVVNANFYMWRTLTPGMTVTYQSVSVKTVGSDTFATLWEKLAGTASPDYTALATAIDNAVDGNLTGALRAGAVLVGPVAKTGTAAEKPSNLSAKWNVDADDLLHANRSLTGFLAANVTVSFNKPDGSGAVTLMTRPKETVNTFYSYVRTQKSLEKLEEETYINVLAQTDGLIAAGILFVVPPSVENIVTTANRNFPGKIFPVTVSINLARVNFRVTTQTIASLKAVPDVTDAQADCLMAMATAARLYLDGDEFDKDLRSAFGSQADIDYLIMLTRRFASLPTTLLDASFKDVKGAWYASSQCPAQTSPSSSDSLLQTLTPFAASFEDAFDKAVKIGLSAGKSNIETQESARKLWAIDFSASGYGFHIDHDKPSFFARKPITNKLQSGTVPMRIYVSGEGVPVDAPPVDVKNANLDLWTKQFFQAMDLVLSPAYAVPIYQQLLTTYQTIVGIKEELAGKVSENLTNLLKSPAEPGVLADAQAAFKDRLMIQLSDAYNIETVLQFPVTVTNGGPEAEGLKPPRLFGQPRNIPYTTKAVETIDSMATALHVSKSYLVEQIADMPGILNVPDNPDIQIIVTYTPTGKTATPTNNDSLATLAYALGAASAQDLIDNITVTPSGQGLFETFLPINVTPVSYTASKAMDIKAVALILDVSVRQLAEAMQDTPGLFNPAVTSLTWTYGEPSKQVTVQVSFSSTFNTLAQSFAAGGVTPAPDAVAVANYFRLLPANLIAQGATVYLVEILPNYNLSNTTVSLSNGNSTLTFFLDVANAAEDKKVFMDLDYIVNQIEHDIRSNADDPNYEESSWINFIIPFDAEGGNTDTSIGLTEIPIANENYPDNPILTSQGGINSELPPFDVTVMDMKKWDYFYEFEYREAAQDIIITGITINDVSGSNNLYLTGKARMLSATPNNLLDALAQFNANCSNLMEDLQQLQSLKPGDTNNAATSAAQAFADFAGQINGNWGILPTAPVLPRSNQGSTGGAHNFKLLFTRDRETDDYLDTLIFMADASGETVWPGKVEVCYNSQWYELTKETTNPVTESMFTYPLHTVKADITLIHRVYFEGLDVIVFQSAGSYLQVKRNEVLSSQAMTQDAFIYQTPVIASPNMFTPLIDRPDPYLLTPPVSPNDLTGALSEFFKELFDISSIAWPTGTTRLISLHVSYRYNLIPGQPLEGSALTPLVPTILHTQYTFQIHPENGNPDYEIASGTFVYNVNDVVNKWIQANLDSGQKGYLVFDVVVFEEKTNTNPSPVLKMHNLLWELKGGGDEG